MALSGLHSHFKENLDGYDYFSLNQLEIKALNLEYEFKNVKDTYKTHHSNTQIVEFDSDTSDDVEKEVYAAEFVWPSVDKPCSFSSLKPTQKCWQEEVKFTFDVSKCDHIFDEFIRL